MKTYLILAVVAALIAVGVYRKGLLSEPRDLPRSAVSSGEDVCKEKRFCVAVYMAPWCPHCKNAVGTLQAFARKSKDADFPGLKVYVGDGEDTAMKSMADKFGDNGFVDADRSVMQKYAVRGYPTFLVLDADGDVILRDQEAYQWVNEKLN